MAQEKLSISSSDEFGSAPAYKDSPIAALSPNGDRKDPTTAHDSKNLAPPPIYPTELPNVFPIGQHIVQPLLTVAELQNHLHILGAFHKLRENVGVEASKTEPATNPESAWAVYVAKAVHRFNKWCHGLPLSVRIDGDSLPPIDVLMVWHAYLLNPRCYSEDSARKVSELAGATTFPISDTAASIERGALLPYQPSATRVEQWKCDPATADEPFELPLLATHEEKFTLSCPKCPPWLEGKVDVPWVTGSGSGYAQSNFKAKCPRCEQEFDKEAIRVRRFCEDATSVLRGHSFLSGLLVNPQTGAVDQAYGRETAENFLQNFNVGMSKLSALTGLERAQKCHFKIAGLRKYFHAGVIGSSAPRRIQRVLSAYESPYPFSIDLQGAVLRQGSFIKKMYELHWTETERFSGIGTQGGDLHVLVRAIARYHAFLDLMQSTKTLLVPTLDIDLAWHTHQLKTQCYRRDTLRYVDRIPDHDDKVEEGALSNAFEHTARLWKDRYGVPYTVCGCVPIAPSITEKLSSFFHHHKSSTIEELNSRKDLCSTDDRDAEATHPSDHNSVHLVGHSASEKLRKERETKAAKVLGEFGKEYEKKKYRDEWEKLVVERTMKHGTITQNRPFLQPTPYWGITPLGYLGLGGCATFNPSVIQPSDGSGCASGIGGSGAGTTGGCGSNCGNCGGGGSGGDSGGGGNSSSCGSAGDTGAVSGSGSGGGDTGISSSNCGGGGSSAADASNCGGGSSSNCGSSCGGGGGCGGN